MSDKDSDRLVSGYGVITFAALRYPIRRDKNGDPEDKIYKVSVRLSEADPFVDEVRQVNSAIVVKDQDSAGHVIIGAKSSYPPIVYDETGKKLSEDEVPLFDSRTDSGLARLEVVKKKHARGGSIYLKVVQLKDLHLAPKEDKGSGSRSELEKLIQAEHDSSGDEQ